MNFSPSGEQKIKDIALAALPIATESTKGITQIATTSDVNAGSDDFKYVTPKKMKAYVAGAIPPAPTVGDASTTAKGITMIATQEDVNAGADSFKYVTPSTLKSYVDARVSGIPTGGGGGGGSVPGLFEVGAIAVGVIPAYFLTSQQYQAGYVTSPLQHVPAWSRSNNTGTSGGGGSGGGGGGDGTSFNSGFLQTVPLAGQWRFQGPIGGSGTNQYGIFMRIG